jgi:hypothetical protein
VRLHLMMPPVTTTQAKAKGMMPTHP